jgi:hypothetical protein
MNERLEKLAEQAGFKNVVGVLDGKVELQKFAELIVRECITNIEQDRFRNADDLNTEYDDGYVDGMGRAERILKEHFGVEL